MTVQSLNHLLGVLPEADYEALRPRLATVQLKAREVLSEASEPIPAVYFPLDAVISVTAAGTDGSSVEVGSVGCEGMVGLPLLFGTDRSINRSVVQIGGGAEQVSAEALPGLVGAHASLRRLLLLYAQAFLTQLSRSTACNRLHSAEQRLARWLLICRDRVGRDEMPVTHETMALMLGVRRATVTEAAGELQRAGLIRYRRGIVAVAHRHGLESVACECYGIV